MMTDKPKYEIYLDENTHAHISFGNKKLGKNVMTFSLLPTGDILTDASGKPLCNVVGSCAGCDGNCKNVCYAKKYVQRFHNTCVKAYAENTILARFDCDRLFSEIQKAIDSTFVSVFRFHVSGEIISENYLNHIIDLASANPTVRFYTYTKRIDMVNKTSANRRFPENLVILFSEFNNEINNPFDFPVFAYDDQTTNKYNDVFHCPAVDKNGHETGITCSACKRCMFAKTGEKIAVYSH